MSRAADRPPVCVVIPTRGRPEMLRSAVDAVVRQDYPGQVDVLVVHDGEPADHSIARDDGLRTVRAVVNERAPGLAGARNTGVLAADHEIVAFCDDDDTWLPGKLGAQVGVLLDDPAAEMVSSGIRVDFEGRSTDRLAGSDAVTFAQLLRSRMAMLHSSTFVLRRAALVDGIGLLDEDLPGAQNEDWDLLLRAARRRPIAVVDRALVRVRWGRTSFYARRWDTKIASLEAMLERHPEIGQDPVGAARVAGQLAFAQACAGRRREAARQAGRAVRAHRREWRAGAALLVASGLVSGDRVLETLHRFGRGV